MLLMAEDELTSIGKHQNFVNGPLVTKRKTIAKGEVNFFATEPRRSQENKKSI